MENQINLPAAEKTIHVKSQESNTALQPTSNSCNSFLAQKVKNHRFCRIAEATGIWLCACLDKFSQRIHSTVLSNDRGAVTAEYAIVIMAAVAFAGLLVAIMGSSEVRALLVGMVERALGSAG